MWHTARRWLRRLRKPSTPVVGCPRGRAAAEHVSSYLTLRYKGWISVLSTGNWKESFASFAAWLSIGVIHIRNRWILLGWRWHRTDDINNLKCWAQTLCCINVWYCEEFFYVKTISSQGKKKPPTICREAHFVLNFNCQFEHFSYIIKVWCTRTKSGEQCVAKGVDWTKV